MTVAPRHATRAVISSSRHHQQRHRPHTPAISILGGTAPRSSDMTTSSIAIGNRASATANLPEPYGNHDHRQNQSPNCSGSMMFASRSRRRHAASAIRTTIGPTVTRSSHGSIPAPTDMPSTVSIRSTRHTRLVAQSSRQGETANKPRAPHRQGSLATVKTPRSRPGFAPPRDGFAQRQAADNDRRTDRTRPGGRTASRPPSPAWSAIAKHIHAANRQPRGDAPQHQPNDEVIGEAIQEHPIVEEERRQQRARERTDSKTRYLTLSPFHQQRSNTVQEHPVRPAPAAA